MAPWFCHSPDREYLLPAASMRRGGNPLAVLWKKSREEIGTALLPAPFWCT
jgi:hypothetical protein